MVNIPCFLVCAISFQNNNPNLGNTLHKTRGFGKDPVTNFTENSSGLLVNYTNSSSNYSLLLMRAKDTI